MVRSIWQRRELRLRDQGFTLPELIVAMFVIGLILTLLIGVQLQAQATIKDARLRQQATALANEALEEMRAIPWSVLTNGMHQDFVTESGDTRVTGGKLYIDNQEFTLLIAPSGAPVSTLWRPLFTNAQGSNKQDRVDPGLTGSQFTVRSYVTRPDGAATDGVGLVVVVEWTDTKGLPRHTLVSSPAYASLGCGAAGLSPFAGACQAMYSSAASSGTFEVAVGAWNGDTANPQTLPVVPNSDYYSFTVHSAVVSAVAESVQTAQVTGTATFGGSSAIGNPTIEPVAITSLGNSSAVLSASTGPQIPGAIPANPAPLSNVSAAANAESFQTLSGQGVTLTGRSDFRRPVSIKSSSTSSCTTGVPSNATCAYVALANRNPDTSNEASSPLWLELNGQILRYATKVPSAGNNTESAFASRFAQSVGTTAVGCTTLVGSGCISAGANRNLGTLRFGRLDSGVWSGGANQLAEITEYQDTVLVQRGVWQSDTPATVTRSGTLRYWDGSSTQTATFNKESNFTVAIGSATWYSTDPNFWVEVVSGSVTVTPSVEPPVDNTGHETCLSAACTVSANSGVITVTYQLVIHTPDNPAGLWHQVTATINPVSATASFKDYQP